MSWSLSFHRPSIFLNSVNPMSFSVPHLSFDSLQDSEALQSIAEKAREAGAVVINDVPNLPDVRRACLQAIYKFAVETHR